MKIKLKQYTISTFEKTTKHNGRWERRELHFVLRTVVTLWILFSRHRKAQKTTLPFGEGLTKQADTVWLDILVTLARLNEISFRPYGFICRLTIVTVIEVPPWHPETNRK